MYLLEELLIDVMWLSAAVQDDWSSGYTVLWQHKLVDKMGSH